MNDTITILLATYNGEKYIEHQLDSLFAQTYTNWRLLIRDDGSQDETLSLVHKYQKEYPGKITLMVNKGTNKGSLQNFSALLQAAGDAEYIMFCDQDDEWKSDKIELTLSKMKEREKKEGTNCPIFIFTNFQYVDEKMNVIESKKNFEINRIHNFGFSQLMAQNPVYGCTTMMNRALTDVVGTIPPQADYHDHWIALVAAAFGELCYIKEKTVLYRQHGNNVSGSFDNDSFSKRLHRIFVNQKNVAEVRKKYIMLLCFRDMYGERLNNKDKKIMNNFICLYERKKLSCLVKSIRHKIRSQTLAQTVLFYTTVLFTRFSS